MHQATIQSNNINIHPSVKFGKNVNIKCDSIELGEFCIIGDNVTIECNSFEADSWLFMHHGVEVGRGGCNSPHSNVKIGKGVGIFENTILNPSEPIEIGDNCGVGAEVMIWTHGAWLDITQGFPSDFGPVKIGKNVWLPARSIVLPNVTIGDDVVIGINSIVNKNLPSGCLAAGAPCKIIKKDMYPKKYSKEKISSMINEILSDWFKLLDFKGVTRSIKVRYENGKIYLNQSHFETIYSIDDRIIEGHTNDVSEDLRDYLRRRGIKFFTDKGFRSI